MPEATWPESAKARLSLLQDPLPLQKVLQAPLLEPLPLEELPAATPKGCEAGASVPAAVLRASAWALQIFRPGILHR